MNLSFWENNEWFKDLDLVVIGSGIVGLSTAINYRIKNRKAKILVLEKGILPDGASTKNAGFTCFGSPSEILADLQKNSLEEVVNLIERRIKGLELLKKTLGEKKIDYRHWHGYEVFDNELDFERCHEKLDDLNICLKIITGIKNTYENKSNLLPKMGFGNRFSFMICNKGEGQIDAGKMMFELIKLANKNNIRILNSTKVNSIDFENSKKVIINMGTFSIESKKLAICTNGFFNELIKDKFTLVEPARAQVLITSPIENLKLKGCFHFDEGYYYFRNYKGRVLLGGGRNLDFKTEKTSKMELNKTIQNRLIEMLKNDIIPGKKFKIEQQWSGIMGVGETKTPHLKKLSENVVCAVKLGGMGVALGSLLGKEAAELLLE
jgi:glycine/D-amino acid oxidase-like deaminating enzyme